MVFSLPIFNREYLICFMPEGVKRKLIYSLVFIFMACLAKAQFDPGKFLKEFESAQGIAKVRLTALYPYSELKPIYPRIKDSLIKIKTDFYRSPDFLNDPQGVLILFDKIEFEKLIDEQNLPAAIFTAENALRYHTKNINDTLRCLKMIKNAYFKINNINKAFEYEFMLQSHWPRKNDTLHIDYGFPASTLYFRMGLKTEAVRQRRLEFKNQNDRNDPEAIVNYNNDMGVFFNSKETADSAVVYFLNAKKTLSEIKYGPAKEKHYTFYKGLVDGNLGAAYKMMERYSEAVSLLRNDVYASKKTEHYQSAFNACTGLVACYIKLGDRNNARLYLDTCEYLASKDIRNREQRMNLLVAQAEYFTFTGDYKNATDKYQKYYFLNDSLQVLEKEERLIAQGVALDIEKRAQEIAEKENALRQLQRQEDKGRSVRVYVVIGVLAALLIISILILSNRTFKRREAQLSFKNEQIQVQHSQIEQTLKEKEALIREIHHRVKNNLQIINSMLNLQIGKIQDEKTETILFEARQRINAIALTHQMLYQRSTISNINLSEYIETLVRQIEAAMSLSNISTVVQVSPTNEKLTIDGAVPLGLVINELLTNAYKHAFPGGRSGSINVSLTENENSFTISVTDNGVGLPKSFDYSESKTLGMELVFILVEQLDSKLIVNTTNSGTTFKFDVKKHG
jgi:two-component sensor histidine kinase